MEKPYRGYYAVIPANVRYDKDLPANAKLLYGEITALCNERGYCWASNNYFAGLYSSTTRTVQLWIKALEGKGYIHVDLEKAEGSSNTKRYISLTEFHPPMKKFSPPHEENFVTPHEKNFTHNNTDINTTSNSNNMSGTPDLVARVISYLNRKAGVAYKPNTQATIRLIHAREKEGFKAEDFKAVIDNMCREWKNDPKMKKYLRPATLFAASKFEGYLNMGRKVVTSPSDGLSQEERKKRKEQELAEMTERLKADKEKEELAKQEQERKRQEYLNSPEYKRMKAKGEAFMKKLIGGE